MFDRNRDHHDHVRASRTVAPAPYALPRGVPALQVEPMRVRCLLVLTALLALGGGILAGLLLGLFSR